jgi:hypothetical protein
MTHSDFEALCDTLLGDARKNIMVKKGREYAGNEDRLANFKRGAANCGVKPETVLYVYLSKHIDSLSTFIRDLEKADTLGSVEGKLTEPISERIKDAINYLLLLHGLIEERRSQAT